MKKVAMYRRDLLKVACPCLLRKQPQSTRGEEWQGVVGLEVHAQLDTRSKLFSGAENVFGGAVNGCVALLDAATPGTLPALNRRAVELGVAAALALDCTLHRVSSFDRKHYFYADLPAGYQITQQRAPLATDGVLNFQVFTPGVHKKPYMKSSKIKQIQLEQDSGKSLHDPELKRSLVDLNRAGAPLIELVFEPDLEDGEEAAALVRELVLVVRRLGACSGRLERGALRVDANVSIRRAGEPLGTRTEIKNIGSVRGVAAAVRHELARQRAAAARGVAAAGGTRAWDAAARATVPMRDKEKVMDYRYMPEPNLPPLVLNLESTAECEHLVSARCVAAALPELPAATRARLAAAGLRAELAAQLVAAPRLLQYYTAAAPAARHRQRVAGLLVNDLLTVLNKARLDPDDCKITDAQLAQVIDLLLTKQINLETTKNLLHELLFTDESSPAKIVKEKGWSLIVDEEEIQRRCQQVIVNNPQMVKQYKEGKTKVFKALLGVLAKESGGQVDMAAAARRLEEMLKSDQ